MYKTSKNIFLGKIVSFEEQIILVEREGDYYPSIHELLFAEENKEILLEVHSYKNDHELYCLLFSPKKYVRRNMRIVATGRTIAVPVGSKILGRSFDLFGNPEDGLGEIESTSWKSIFSKKEEKNIVTGKKEDAEYKHSEFLETGIKSVDFFAPIIRGGKIGIVGGAGVGKTILMTEILRNLSTHHKGVSIFGGIGERIREGFELRNLLEEYGILKRTALVLGNINKNAAVRLRTANAIAALVEYFRDEEKQDVLLVIDNIFRYLQAGSELATLLGEIPSEFGYQSTLQTEIAEFENQLISNKNGNVTSIQTVYIPADELSNPSVVASLPYFNAVIILSREMTQSARHPAIDPFISKSSLIDRKILGADHYNAITESIEILNEYKKLSRIVTIVGEEELSIDNQKKYNRAQKILNYMTQPFFTTEDQTGKKGIYVSREHTIRDVKKILSGDYDKIPSAEFLEIGAIEKTIPQEKM